MFKKRLLYSVISLLILTFSIYFALELVKIQHLKKITSETVQTDSFKKVIEAAEPERNKHTITIHLKLADKYDNLKLIDQFAVFEFLNRQIRYFLLVKEFQNPFYNFDFEIIGRTTTNTYTYINPLSQKELSNTSESVLQLNGKNIYNKRTFLQNLNRELISEKNEFEILQYAEQLFSLISMNGKYHNHNVDSKIIYQGVEEQYGITENEYLDIYYKCYLGFGYEGVASVGVLE